MKHLAFHFLMMFLMLAACGPSDAEIQATVQASIAQTQTAIPTPTPTPTVNPCSDRGWADITIYLHQFDQEARSVQAGISISAFLQQLKNTEDKINAVSVDACTEHARQLIISGLGNMIYAFQLISMPGGTSNDEVTQVMNKGALMIANALIELRGLGIHLNYP